MCVRARGGGEHACILGTALDQNEWTSDLTQPALSARARCCTAISPAAYTIAGWRVCAVDRGTIVVEAASTPVVNSSDSLEVPTRDTSRACIRDGPCSVLETT